MQIYMLDLKKEGSVTRAELASSSPSSSPTNESFSPPPDVILYICDGDVVDLVKGRLNGI